MYIYNAHASVCLIPFTEQGCCCKLAKGLEMASTHDQVVSLPEVPIYCCLWDNETLLVGTFFHGTLMVNTGEWPSCICCGPGPAHIAIFIPLQGGTLPQQRECSSWCFHTGQFFCFLCTDAFMHPITPVIVLTLFSSLGKTILVYRFL